jgi:hypothetical protein
VLAASIIRAIAYQTTRRNKPENSQLQRFASIFNSTLKMEAIRLSEMLVTT